MQILKAIEDGYNTKMKIMHSVGLPDHTATRLLKELASERLISQEAGAIAYRLSAAGKSRLDYTDFE